MTEHESPAASRAEPPNPSTGPSSGEKEPGGAADLPPPGREEAAHAAVPDPREQKASPTRGNGRRRGADTVDAPAAEAPAPDAPSPGAGRPSGDGPQKRAGRGSRGGSSAAKRASKPPAKSGAKPTGKAAGKTADKPAAKPTSKPTAKPASKPTARNTGQGTAKSAAKNADRSGAHEPVDPDPGAATRRRRPGPHPPEDPAAPPPGALAPPAGTAVALTGPTSAEAGESAERERRGGDRLRFVGAATRRIARGVDLDETVLGLCRASVPAYSDAILVYLSDPLPVGDERPVSPVVLRLRRSDRIPEERRGSGLPLVGPARGDSTGESAAEHTEVRPGGPLAEVLRGVRPVFAESDAANAALPELLGSGCDIPEGYRAILAPLRGRRRVIGAAVFLRRPERPAFDAEDLLVAAQLATHTALGVDKAVLYGREAYIADELQRTMLPDALPQPTGCTLASRYLPAAETARVGGDWYDAIPLPGSRVALVVGDVMGHSMTSAAIMGQLRTTAQTLAGLDLPPQEVLHHLDEQAQRLGSDRMATCLYAVYDPVAHRILIANAGHPPPVLLHRDGRAEVLRIPAGAPIGVGGVDFEAVELDAPEGATLILYTDGLVESRTRDVWTGIDFLRQKLAETARLTRPGTAPPLEPLCDEVLDILGPGDRDDDIALLAARFDGITPSDVAYWYLDPRAQTAGQARRLARRALARWGLEELTDAAELLVSEVVTNAVRYAERPITLRLLRTDMLRCEVGDDVPQLPRLRQARATDEGGRGLYLVNRIASRWGATRLSTGKVVWFELALPSGSSAQQP
ncbi:SpoIIE family protein phosphatase [Streptomyces sp. N2-109]|uniref:SpoIIE family protein phosphatase n=1 Tax=Streptomyces gossypii TaxID=2883101 RepID=A0ABT2JVQ9_9ACTN|nr:SpoIIE family protein phosphatase [Streptomyces gossypii]MCT2591982.1 SpoIIE family protein phosphatase [Streptomyces gossypii]